jgi:hypothetical protein
MSGVRAPALDHEVRYDAVEDRAVVVSGLRVVDEVLDGPRRLVGEEFDLDVAHRGGQNHHWISLLLGLVCGRLFIGGAYRER